MLLFFIGIVIDQASLIMIIELLGYETSEKKQR